MKFNTNEISAYLIIVMVTILLSSAVVFLTDSPNLSVPNNPDIPELTNPITQDPLDPVDPPTRNTSAINFINILFYVLLGVVIFLVLRASMNLRMVLNKGRQSRKIGQDVIRRNLEDARTQAYQIIEEGLVNHTYKISFIDAYIALDLGLEDFRELKRPKHITPKEYAYSVKSPVFQPSVYKFVSKFYELRYGDRSAERGDLVDFRTQLEFLFIEDVPLEIKIGWEEDFHLKTGQEGKFVIPRVFDPKLPRGVN